MDRLDELMDAAGPLLRRAGEVLDEAGAPAGHPLWEQLRRVRVLPADAAQAVAALRPAAFAEVVPGLRAGAQTCAEIAAGLPAPGEWSGEAAETYDDLRRRSATHLAGGDDSLDERWTATADLADALQHWMIRTRTHLAAALADLLTSAEALTLTSSEGAPPPSMAEIRAAADVATLVLRTIADDYLRAEELLRDSAALAEPIPL